MKGWAVCAISLFACVGSGCFGQVADSDRVDRQQTAWTAEELVLDAHHEADGAGSNCGTTGTRLGQEFIPTLDNLAAVDITLNYWGSTAITVPLTVRVLEDPSTFAGAWTSDPPGPALASTTFDVVLPAAPAGGRVELQARGELSTPLPVVPGHVYALEVSWPPTSDLYWTTDGTPGAVWPVAATNCLGEWSTSRAYGYATWALAAPPSPPPAFGDAEDVLDAASPEPADGDMTGPTRGANEGRLRAFRNQLRAAEENFESGNTAEGCANLESLRRKVTGDHAWFAGDTAAALLAILDALATDRGCP